MTYCPSPGDAIGKVNDALETINQELGKIPSLQDALKQARALGAFRLPGVVFYHHKLHHFSHIKRDPEQEKKSSCPFP